MLTYWLARVHHKAGSHMAEEVLIAPSHWRAVAPGLRLEHVTYSRRHHCAIESSREDFGNSFFGTHYLRITTAPLPAAAPEEASRPAWRGPLGVRSANRWADSAADATPQRRRPASAAPHRDSCRQHVRQQPIGDSLWVHAHTRRGSNSLVLAQRDRVRACARMLGHAPPMS